MHLIIFFPALQIICATIRQSLQALEWSLSLSQIQSSQVSEPGRSDAFQNLGTACFDVWFFNTQMWGS